MRLAFGPRAIFDNVSAVVNKGDKIGLVGSNGAGKTTLLKILAGIESPDSGELAKPGYATVGYLPQESLVAGSRPLYDEAESAFESIVGMREKIAQADAVIRLRRPVVARVRRRRFGGRGNREEARRRGGVETALAC